ncbi:SRPBCC family protein [Antrihabitans sp. YC2-6]|nr:SRPBCC family protein [Antrihabitans sp. YC2-6]
MEFHIAAEPAAIMAALAAVEELPGWSGPHKKIVVETRFDDGRPHRVRADVGAVGLTDHQVTDFTWDGVQVMTWTLRESSMQAAQNGSYRLTPTATGTRVLFDLELAPKVPLPNFIVKKVVKIAMETASKGLTKFVESRVTQAA